MLKAIDLCKSFEGPQGKLSILRGLNLELRKGDLAFILGRSGAGKSTLLHLLGGLDRPTSGCVEFENEDIGSWNQRKLCAYRNRMIGFVFQFYHLLPELTVKENVGLPSLIRGRFASRRADELLKRVGLWQRRGHLPQELSGGEQQRVAIARSLMNEPKLVLCDEPTGNLDDETAKAIQDLIVKLNQEGQTFLIVTHEERFARKGTYSYRLQDGTIDRAF